MTEAVSQTERRLRFDGTITAGSFLQALVLVATVMVWGLRLEGRVDQQELLRIQLEKRIEMSEAVNASASTEIKAQVRDISAKLDRLIERLSSPVPAGRER